MNARGDRNARSGDRAGRGGRVRTVATSRLHSQESETQTDIETITGLAQRILKPEWQRVKLGT